MSNSNHSIIYQSPADGETYVPAKSSLIIRLEKSAVVGHTASDFSFLVRGETSGTHTGSVYISDDNATILFEPVQPFALGERVETTFKILNNESFSPVSYSFRVTQISDERREEMLQRAFESLKSDAVPQDIQSDSATFPVMTIDTITPDKLAPGSIFFTPEGNSVGTKFAFIAIADNTGKPEFSRQILPIGCENFRVWPNNKLSYFRVDRVLAGGLALEGKTLLMDTEFVVIDSFDCGNGFLSESHEFQLLPNGHALVIAYDVRDTDMRIVLGDTNALPNVQVIGSIIQELDLQKKVILQWRSWDHFKITDVTHTNLKNSNIIDYTHLNSVEADIDGNLIASFRSMDEATKINRTNAKTIWRWGGKNNYFTFLGDTLQFSHQHDVRRIASGNITMWDNGNNHTSVWGDGSMHDTAFSRAIEYELDESNLTAKAVWEYTDVPFSSAAGNVQRLPNGNTFIGLGFVNAPNAMEITPSGEKVFQLSMPIGTFNYRTFRFVFPQSTSSVGSKSPLADLELESISPNPASTQITVRLTSADPGNVILELVDVIGHSVRLAERQIPAEGVYSMVLDVRSVPEGMYFCRLSQGGKILIRPVIIRR
ncbi:MAG: aryl-sulfate sulfotransferase [Bacteroidota bacterium]|nr:aryl-sulfate sulfotransferase [Bacteroidota bacterium]MDP4230592.1 aryl-sulfate sulfotransferase [Bacteroidota bacterium]MDP4236248.1 aryl-sulfate sulfotransferase [Bacteroidota bacterium]